MRVLVTGVAGFLGRHVLARLRREADILVFGTDRRDVPGLEWFRLADLSQATDASALVQDAEPDCVIHLAGLATGDEAELLAANVDTTRNLLLALVERGGRFVGTGSAAEYGPLGEESMPIVEETPCHPAAPYGRTKLMASQLILGWGGTVLRPFNIIGAGVPDTLVAGAIAARIRFAVESGAPVIPVGNIDTSRDFVAVEDVAEAFLCAIRREPGGQVFNVCSGRPTSIRTLIEMFMQQAGVSLELRQDPQLMRPDDPKAVYGSRAKAKAAWGWEPRVPLGEAVHRAWVGA